MTIGEREKFEEERIFLVGQVELANNFIRANVTKRMILCTLSFLSPELRPVTQICGGKLVSSRVCACVCFIEFWAGLISLVTSMAFFFNLDWLSFFFFFFVNVAFVSI